MQENTEHLDGPVAVRDYVTRMLCSRDNLEPDCFAVSEAPLKRGVETCGVYFCLHGPRLLRLTAIWETETNTILFYGSRGERFLRTRLAACPAAATAA